MYSEPIVGDGEALVLEAFRAGLRPDPIVTVSEWADQNRLTSRAGAAEPWRWRTARTPYLREPMDALSTSSPVLSVTVKKGAQLGFTEAGNNWVGFVIDHAPGPMMCVVPTDKSGKRAARQRLDPLLEDTPSLQGKVARKKSRDSSNTLDLKEFAGGMLAISSAGAAADLRSMPIRYLFLDEIDAYPEDLGEEGDPVALAERGTRTFPNRKTFKISTPTIGGRSRIEREHELGDQREYEVPCPFCGAMQTIEWKRLEWESEEAEKPSDVYRALLSGDRLVSLRCVSCEELIPEHHKTEMLEAGEWVPRQPGAGDLVRSYAISSLYSPLGWFSWNDAASQWIRAQGRPNLLRVFVNQVLGETWKEKGDAPNWKLLYQRRETYRIGQVPKGGVLLTAGVDVQADRLELELVAWGRELESWSIDFHVIAGAPTEAETWKALERYLASPFPHATGLEMRIRRTAIDSGYETQAVYAWVRKQSRNLVIACKGQDSYSALLGQPRAMDVNLRGRKIKRGVLVWPTGVSLAKEELYGWLRQEHPLHPDEDGYPRGWVHFPQYGEEWFRQLCAEQLVARVVKGRRKYEWEQTRERNEALDCRILARMAASTLGVDRWGPEQWTEAENTLGAPPTPPAARSRKKRRGRNVDLSRWNHDR